MGYALGSSPFVSCDASMRLWGGVCVHQLHLRPSVGLQRHNKNHCLAMVSLQLSVAVSEYNRLFMQLKYKSWSTGFVQVHQLSYQLFSFGTENHLNCALMGLATPVMKNVWHCIQSALCRKVFTELKSEGNFPKDFYRTRSLFQTTAITL